MKFTDFVERYPNYNTNRFSQDVNGNVRFLFNGNDYNPYDKNGNLVKTVYEFPSWRGETPKPENIHDFLNAFPKALLLTCTNKKYPIPAVDLEDEPDDIKSPLNIYVTPSKSFTVNLNNVFQLTPPTIQNVSEYSAWLEEPNMKFWSQQLNFAVWAATSGCGIGFNLLEPDTQIASILRFHVIFTIRCILNDLQVPLPWDNNFVWNGTRYNKGVFAKLCNEFGVSNPDFRYKGQSSDVFSFHYISYKDSLTGYYKSTHKSRSQYNWFIPQKGVGITKAGMSPLNQSIEAFVYCVLGAQINTRSPIISDFGSAKETQDVFLKLFESSVIGKDISKSIQRYQLAIQEAKVKLDLAISPGCWLLPSNIIVNTQTVVGYNRDFKIQRLRTTDYGREAL